MYIDSHCHLDTEAFDADRADVIRRARAVGVCGFLVAGVSPAGWPRQQRLAEQTPGVRWSVGLHPVWVARADDESLEAALAALEETLAAPGAPSGIGETGLDTHFAPKETLNRQVRGFRRQLDVARSGRLPVVLHVVGRGSHGRALEILRADGPPRAGGVVHAYSGSAELVADYVALGLHIGFAGPVARANAVKVRRAASRVPLERLLLETDAPDLSPQGGRVRNEPSALLVVADAVAELRASHCEVILERSAHNSAYLFGSFTDDKLQ